MVFKNYRFFINQKTFELIQIFNQNFVTILIWFRKNDYLITDYFRL